MTSRFFLSCAGLLLALLLHAAPGAAQPGGNTRKPSAVPCPTPELMPEYPGGQGALLRFISSNLQYPALAQQQGIQGKVYVKFMVDTAGAVRNVVVQKGIGGGCDEEALRVVQALARFTPGKQDCRPIEIYMNVPINFALTPAAKGK